jgi:hypothetical protein
MNAKSIASIGVALAIAAALHSTISADGRFDRARLIVGATQVEGELVCDSSGKRLAFEAAGTRPVDIPFDAIKSIRYERSARPNYAAGLLVAWPLLFTKTKQHYVTVQYNDAAGEGKFHLFRLDKRNVRGALDTLEADSGIRVERFEER